MRVVAHEVGRRDDSDDPPVALQGKVVDAVLEHHLPRAVDRRPVGHRADRAARHVPGRSGGAEARGENAVAQVAVGDDRRRVGSEEDRADALVAHDAGGLEHRRLGRDGDGRPFDERADGEEDVPAAVPSRR